MEWKTVCVQLQNSFKSLFGMTTTTSVYNMKANASNGKNNTAVMEDSTKNVKSSWFSGTKLLNTLKSCASTQFGLKPYIPQLQRLNSSGDSMDLADMPSYLQPERQSLQEKKWPKDSSGSFGKLALRSSTFNKSTASMIDSDLPCSVINNSFQKLTALILSDSICEKFNKEVRTTPYPSKLQMAYALIPPSDSQTFQTEEDVHGKKSDEPQLVDILAKIKISSEFYQNEENPVENMENETPHGFGQESNTSSDVICLTTENPSPLIDLCRFEEKLEQLPEEGTNWFQERALAFELCASPSTSMAGSPTLRTTMAVNIPNAPPPFDLCDKHRAKTPENGKTLVKAPWIVLTPKTTCLSDKVQKRKKTRPSSKKRHRQQMQRCDDDLAMVHGQHKKTTNRPSTVAKMCDGLSFVIDFSESEVSEGELQSCSPKESTSPVATVSWMIAAEDTTDSADSSDSDFFEDDHVCMDFTDFSPFTFQITCNFADVGTSERDTNTFEEEISERLKKVNSRWQASYGSVPLEASYQHEVHFASEDLTTVYTIQPEDVEAYRAARKGQWEEYARDRDRFNKRIQDLSTVISPCLTPEHRLEVCQRSIVSLD